MPLKVPLRDRVDSETLSGHLSRRSLFRIKFVKTSGPPKTGDYIMPLNLHNREVSCSFNLSITERGDLNLFTILRSNQRVRETTCATLGMMFFCKKLSGPKVIYGAHYQLFRLKSTFNIPCARDLKKKEREIQLLFAKLNFTSRIRTTRSKMFCFAWYTFLSWRAVSRPCFSLFSRFSFYIRISLESKLIPSPQR